VLYKSNLDALTWTPIGTIRSIGTLTTFTDTDSARLSQPEGFYQVRQVP
jgi:hypothetical protein